MRGVRLGKQPYGRIEERSVTPKQLVLLRITVVRDLVLRTRSRSALFSAASTSTSEA